MGKNVAQKLIESHLVEGEMDLARQGMSPHALQQFAGHSSIETTNKIYVHIGSDFVGDEVRRIRKGKGG